MPKPDIPYPAFIVQTNGMILISDGTAMVAYADDGEFRLDEPGFLMPPNLISVTYEIKRQRVFASGQNTDFITVPLSREAPPPEFQQRIAEFDGYIAKVPVYQAAIAGREPPPPTIPAAPPAASNPSETMALVNQIRQDLIDRGFYQ